MRLFCIYGAPGVGKTFVSKIIAEREDIKDIIGTDRIRAVLRVNLDDTGGNKIIHIPGIKAYELSPSGDDTIYGFVQQAKALKKSVEAVVENVKKDNLDLILEGIHLIPGMLEFDSDIEVHYVLVTVKSEEQHIEQIRSQEVSRFEYKMQNFDRIRCFYDYLIETVDEKTEVYLNLREKEYGKTKS